MIINNTSDQPVTWSGLTNEGELPGGTIPAQSWHQLPLQPGTDVVQLNIGNAFSNDAAMNDILTYDGQELTLTYQS